MDDCYEKVVMVTGGSGMIGSAIRKIVEQEHNPKEKWVFLSSKDADLIDPEATEAVFDKHKPTHVIHLAAMTGGLLSNIERKGEYLKANVRINDNVYSSCKANVKKLVSCIPTCVFPDKITYPFDETMLHCGPPHPSNYGFSFTKRLLEAQNRVYHEQYGYNFTSVIGTSIFGPFDNFSPTGGHVVGGLISKVLSAKQEGKPFVIFGTGKPRRQFVYSLDFARLILWVLREYPETDPIILTTDAEDEISIKDVAEMVIEASGFTGEVVFDTNKPDGQFRKTASNAKFRKYHPDFKFTPIKQALQETIGWFMDNQSIARV